MRPESAKHRFLLRLDLGLYRQLHRLAKAQQTSVNTLCATLIESGIREATPRQEWIKEVVDAYEPEGLLSIILFGSRSRGDATPSSDLDILLVFPSGTRITRSLYRRLEGLGEGRWSGAEVSFHCVALPEQESEVSGFWLEIALDGKMLWKKNEAITLWLEQVKHALCSGTYVRKLSSGQPYWIKHEK
jgi:predicted nucleotidyltransferase